MFGVSQKSLSLDLNYGGVSTQTGVEVARSSISVQTTGAICKWPRIQVLYHLCRSHVKMWGDKIWVTYQRKHPIWAASVNKASGRRRLRPLGLASEPPNYVGSKAVPKSPVRLAGRSQDICHQRADCLNLGHQTSPSWERQKNSSLGIFTPRSVRVRYLCATAVSPPGFYDVAPQESQ